METIVDKINPPIRICTVTKRALPTCTVVPTKRLASFGAFASPQDSPNQDSSLMVNQALLNDVPFQPRRSSALALTPPSATGGTTHIRIAHLIYHMQQTVGKASSTKKQTNSSILSHRMEMKTETRQTANDVLVVDLTTSPPLCVETEIKMEEKSLESSDVFQSERKPQVFHAPSYSYRKFLPPPMSAKELKVLEYLQSSSMFPSLTFLGTLPLKYRNMALTPISNPRNFLFSTSSFTPTKASGNVRILPRQPFPSWDNQDNHFSSVHQPRIMNLPCREFIHPSPTIQTTSRAMIQPKSIQSLSSFSSYSRAANSLKSPTSVRLPMDKMTKAPFHFSRNPVNFTRPPNESME